MMNLLVYVTRTSIIGLYCVQCWDRPQLDSSLRETAEIHHTRPIQVGNCHTRAYPGGGQQRVVTMGKPPPPPVWGGAYVQQWTGTLGW